MSTEIFIVHREPEVVTVRISQDAQTRRDKLVSENRCVGCEKKFEADEKVSLGLCQECYNAIYYRINKKQITKNQMIREGRMLPKGKRRNRRFANEFTKSLAEM